MGNCGSLQAPASRPVHGVRDQAVRATDDRATADQAMAVAGAAADAEVGIGRISHEFR